MSSDRIYLGGELYLSVEKVAEIYHVETVWLLEAVDAGLLEDGVQFHETACIAAARLDRVATIVRLREVVGPDLDAIRLAMELTPPAGW